MSSRILVVEDEADMVELLSYNLRQRGYEVVVARSGVEALQKAPLCAPTLVVLDLMLEGIDGFTVCETLRRQPSTSSIPIIMVTALSGQMARLNGLGVGANDFVLKPFNLEDLLNRIETQVERYQASVPERRAGTVRGRRS